MRIVCNTPEKLVLRHRPVLLSAGLLAGTLYLAYAGIDNAVNGETVNAFVCLLATLCMMGPGLWYSVERVDVVFDAIGHRCRIYKRRMSGNQSEEHDLADITRAMVQTYKGTDGGGDTHRVALVIGPEKLENRHGLTRSYWSGAEAARTVSRVNEWLAARRT